MSVGALLIPTPADDLAVLDEALVKLTADGATFAGFGPKVVGLGSGVRGEWVGVAAEGFAVAVQDSARYLAEVGRAHEGVVAGLRQYRDEVERVSSVSALAERQAREALDVYRLQAGRHVSALVSEVNGEISRMQAEVDSALSEAAHLNLVGAAVDLVQAGASGVAALTSSIELLGSALGGLEGFEPVSLDVGRALVPVGTLVEVWDGAAVLQQLKAVGGFSRLCSYCGV